MKLLCCNAIVSRTLIWDHAISQYLSPLFCIFDIWNSTIDDCDFLFGVVTSKISRLRTGIAESVVRSLMVIYFNDSFWLVNPYSFWLVNRYSFWLYCCSHTHYYVGLPGNLILSSDVFCSIKKMNLDAFARLSHPYFCSVGIWDRLRSWFLHCGILYLVLDRVQHWREPQFRPVSLYSSTLCILTGLVFH